MCAAESLYLEKKMVVGTRFSFFKCFGKGAEGNCELFRQPEKFEFLFYLFQKNALGFS